MRHLVLLISFTITVHAGLLAQDDSYLFTFNDNSPREVLREIENKTGFTFYYAPIWLDSMKAPLGSFEGTLNGALDSIFMDTKINYLILEGRIILTYNAPIITKISFDSTEASMLDDSKYIFSREYENDSKNSSIEEKTFVIGRKSEMQVGGTSFISGFVKNESNGEPLAGAFLRSEASTAVSDDRGFYTLRVPNGKSAVQLQFRGMKPTKRTVLVFSDGNLNVNMIPDVVLLENLTIKANADRNVSSVQMGVYKFDLDELKNVPKVFGENDIMKVALALPGVQNVGEGSSGINVRGGKADQNLILLNNATVYNPFHFFGFFSSFNADQLASTELYKSSMPVNFGGRLSSVLDVKTKSGNKEKLTGKGGIGLVTSSLSLEIPVIKGSTSITLGGRSTYSDWILAQVKDEAIRNSSPSFYDLSAGIDHTYGQANYFNASGYYSYDRFRLSTDSLYQYTNFNLSLDWKHYLNKKLSVEFIATTSHYDYQVDYNIEPSSAFTYGFDINDIYGQLKLDYSLSSSHSIQAGIDAKRYQINPGYRKPKTELSTVPFDQVASETGIEAAFFISDDFIINEKWSLTGGIRYSGFAPLGPGTTAVYQKGAPKSVESIIDSVSFSANEFIRTYYGPEFRSSLRYAIDDSRSVKAAFNSTRQYLHSLSNTVSISPTDTWKLSDLNVAPQLANQYSLGYFTNFKDNTIETSAELYYKSSKHIIDYKTNANLLLNKRLETDILQGDGKSYGIELFVRKSTGKVNGWMSYTYSRSLQRFISGFDEETINKGVFFPTNFDKPHVLNLVGNYKLTRRYNFSFNVSYASGRPVTYPTAKYTIGGAPVIHFADRNSFRIPHYFRIDIGVNAEGSHKLKKWAHGFWSFNVYNLLGRDNAYSVFFRSSEGTVKAYQLSVLGSAIPSISYKFEF